MGKLKSYSNTTVSLSKTQEEIEKLLARHKIVASRWTHFTEMPKVPGRVRFEFEWKKDVASAPLGFRIEVDYERKEGPRGGNAGTTREQAGRALFWHVKNLFDAVEWGIIDLEAAFMPYLLPQGTEGPTLYEQMIPRLALLGTEEGALGLLTAER